MVVNHQSVDWNSYFQLIRSECPWAASAWRQGLIDIVEWQGLILPLDHYQARVYVLDHSQGLEALCLSLDHGECEWLFSHPGYGDWATPVPVLIQQNRSELARIRQKLSENNK